MSLTSHTWTDAKGTWIVSLNGGTNPLTGDDVILVITFPDGTTAQVESPFADADIVQAGGYVNYINTVLFVGMVSQIKGWVAGFTAPATPSAQVLAALAKTVWTDSPTGPVPSLPPGA